jgi:hypothetical protein
MRAGSFVVAKRHVPEDSITNLKFYLRQLTKFDEILLPSWLAGQEALKCGKNAGFKTTCSSA